jgi:hypothetical protein
MLPHISPVLEDLFWTAQYGWTAGLQAPLGRIIDDRGVPNPVVKNIEPVYFHRAADADAETLQGCLQRANQLGKDFSQ